MVFNFFSSSSKSKKAKLQKSQSFPDSTALKGINSEPIPIVPTLKTNNAFSQSDDHLERHVTDIVIKENLADSSESTVSKRSSSSSSNSSSSSCSTMSNTQSNNSNSDTKSISPQNSSSSMTMDQTVGGLGSRRSWSDQLDHERDQFVNDINTNQTDSSSGVVLSHPSFLEPSRVKRIRVQHVVIIYNPNSGSKVGEKIMMESRKYFEANNVAVDVVPTEYKGHAEELCRTLDVSLYDVVCLVGGDGTIHEAVNGIMKRDPESRENFVLGCIPAGTGNSFVMELQGKLSIKYQCERILNGLTVPIDVAKVTTIKKESLSQECSKRRMEVQLLKKKYGQFLNVNESESHTLSSSQEAGRNTILNMKHIRPDALMEFASLQQQMADLDSLPQPEVFYSFNSIHWGLGSKVNITAEKMRWMGKAVRYTTAALLELFKGEKILARIEYEDANGECGALEDEFCLAIVNNIQGAAKGMKMAPKAKLNDGLFDLILIKSHKTFDLMHVFASVYDGTHTELDYVIYKQVKRFSITPFKKDKERKKRLRKEKKRIRAAVKAGKEHKSKNPLEILKTECNTILSELEDQIDEEIIDIDGELKGATPFFCEVIPRSVRVVV